MNRLLKRTLTTAFVFTLGLAPLTVTATETEESSAPEDTTTVEGSVELEVNAGIKPTNPLYFLDQGLEKLRLFLANEEKEAKLLLQFAEERLAELEELDEDDVEAYADKLYESYGLNLERVNEIVAEIVATEGETEAIDKLKEQLLRAVEVNDVVEKVDSVSHEIREIITRVHTKSYAVSIATNLDETKVAELKAEGFGYGEILKLQAISELSGKTIDELIFLDIYTEEDEDEKEIDFGKLALEVGLTVEVDGELRPNMEAIRDQFKHYQEVMEDTREELRKTAEEEREALREELKKNLEAARHEMMERITLRLNVRLNNFLVEIDTIYNEKLEMINGLESISEERKAELLSELEEVKIELVEEVTEEVMEGDVNPRDLAKLNLTIHQKLNVFFEHQDLTVEERKAIDDGFNTTLKNVESLFNSILERVEQQTGVVVDDATRESLWLEIEGEIAGEDDFDEELFEELGEEIGEVLRDRFKDRLDPMNQSSTEELFNRVVENLESIVDGRLDAEMMVAFKAEVELHREEIIEEVNDERHMKYRQLMDEIEDLLEDFMEEHEIEADIEIDFNPNHMGEYHDFWENFRNNFQNRD